MGILNLFLIIIMVSSCTHLSYIYQQGVGQISLQAKAKDNDQVLNNVKVPKDHKEKIKKIVQLKKYFYNYWEKKETAIYSKTTMLPNNAVSYLVVASPYNEIKPIETCFYLLGCFPYLGFFNLDSANDFSNHKKAENLVSFVTPIYAYSTIGYFTDSILSSFFYYSDYELAELIFHELFHTLFFAENEVLLNENLANFFAREMLEDYFKSINQLDYLKIRQREEALDGELRKVLVWLTTELQTKYLQQKPKTKEEAQTILDQFLDKIFYPTILNKCQELKMERPDCFPLHKTWNNARFAAFLTYEGKSLEIEILGKKHGPDLKTYYNYIVKKYNEFKNQSEILVFSKYLFK